MYEHDLNKDDMLSLVIDYAGDLACEMEHTWSVHDLFKVIYGNQELSDRLSAVIGDIANFYVFGEEPYHDL